MTDLPPMGRCPSGRKGRHDLMALYVNDTEQAASTDVTFACNKCGAIRRVPMTGRLTLDRVDDWTAEEIEALFR